MKLRVHGMVQVIGGILGAMRSHGFVIDQSAYDVDGIKADDGKAHLIWGTVRPVEEYRYLGRLPNVWFVENGWMTQSSGCYFDKLGPNALSSLRDAIRTGSDGDIEMVDRRVEAVHSWQDLHKPRGANHIFVPLQVEKDTQVLYFSGMDDVRWDQRIPKLVADVCQTFPDYRIEFKVHPRRKQDQIAMLWSHPAVKKHGRCGIHESGNSYQWIKNCRAVVGINSTVLTEALTFHKPVYAYGEGIFSGNGAVMEGGPLREILDFEPDPGRIYQYLTLLFRRQIPYALKSRDVLKYDVLRQMVTLASQEQQHADHRCVV